MCTQLPAGLAHRPLVGLDRKFAGSPTGWLCGIDEQQRNPLQQARAQQVGYVDRAQGAAGGYPPAWNGPDGSGSGGVLVVLPRSSK
jgi:hypothetical protein